MSTLVGIGAREAMPTLFDFNDGDDEPTHPRGAALEVLSESDADINVALEDWSDDEDAPCFDV